MQIEAIKYAAGSFTGAEYVDLIVKGLAQPVGIGKLTSDSVKYARWGVDDGSIHTIVITAPDGNIFYLDPWSIIGFVRVPAPEVEQE